jgi:hypothetical protein
MEALYYRFSHLAPGARQPDFDCPFVLSKEPGQLGYCPALHFKEGNQGALFRRDGSESPLEPSSRRLHRVRVSATGAILDFRRQRRQPSPPGPSEAVFESVYRDPIQPGAESRPVAQMAEPGQSNDQRIMIQVVAIVAVAHQLTTEGSGSEVFRLSKLPK